MTAIQLHNAKSIRVEAIYLDNSHSLCLAIERDQQDGGDVDVSIFNLPTDYIDKVIEAFGEPRRCSYTSEQTVYPAEMKALTRQRDEMLIEVRNLRAELASLKKEAA